MLHNTDTHTATAIIIQRAFRVRAATRKRIALQYKRASSNSQGYIRNKNNYISETLVVNGLHYSVKVTIRKDGKLGDVVGNFGKATVPLLKLLWHRCFSGCNDIRMFRCSRIVKIISKYLERCTVKTFLANGNGNLVYEYHTNSSLEIEVEKQVVDILEWLNRYATAISTGSSEKEWVAKHENQVTQKLESIFLLGSRWLSNDTQNHEVMLVESIKCISRIIATIAFESCQEITDSPHVTAGIDMTPAIFRSPSVVQKLQWLQWDLQNIMYKSKPILKPVNGEFPTTMRRLGLHTWFVLHEPTCSRPTWNSHSLPPFSVLMGCFTPELHINATTKEVLQCIRKHSEEKGIKNAYDLFNSPTWDASFTRQSMERWNRINIYLFCTDLTKAYHQMVTTTPPGSTMLQKILLYFRQQCCHMVMVMQEIRGKTNYRYSIPPLSEIKSITLEQGFLQEYFDIIETHWKSYDKVLQCIAKIRKVLQRLRTQLSEVDILKEYYECTDFEKLLTEECKNALLSYRPRGRCCRPHDYTKAAKKWKDSCGNDLALAATMKELMLGLLEESQHLKHNLHTCLIRKQINAELDRLSK